MKNTITPLILCAIVTYKRPLYLQRCLYAISRSTIKPSRILIYDNDINSDTEDLIESFGVDLPNIILEKSQLNGGGAAGFNYIFEYFSGSGLYDFLWVMDDDGCCSSDELEKLISASADLDIISPLVVNEHDHSSLVFSVPYAKSYIQSIECLPKCKALLTETPYGFFNGTLFSLASVRYIGAPLKHYFLWGDEQEYAQRIERQSKYNCGICLSSVHFHPVNLRMQPVLHSSLGSIIANRDWKYRIWIINTFETHIRGGRPTAKYPINSHLLKEAVKLFLLLDVRNLLFFAYVLFKTSQAILRRRNIIDIIRPHP